MGDQVGHRAGGPVNFSPPQPFPANSTEHDDEGATGGDEREKNQGLNPSPNPDPIESEGYESEEEETRRTSERVRQRAARTACNDERGGQSQKPNKPSEQMVPKKKKDQSQEQADD